MYGILGGTFDPVHLGHIALAEEALRLGMETVFWLPSNIPPHRAEPQNLPFHRANMVQLAIEHEPRFRLDDREQKRPGPSYMIDTLRSFRDTEGKEIPLCLILGADAFNSLDQWKEWEALIDYAHILVVSRAGYPCIRPLLLEKRSDSFEQLKNTPHGLVYYHSANIIDISSTQLRQNLDGHYLPLAVKTYLQQMNTGFNSILGSKRQN